MAAAAGLDVERYVRSIRNTGKRAYAEQYLAWRRGQRRTAPETGGLSYMAAQAVRLTIREYVR
jgi:hypothetical protein